MIRGGLRAIRWLAHKAHPAVWLCLLAALGFSAYGALHFPLIRLKPECFVDTGLSFGGFPPIEGELRPEFQSLLVKRLQKMQIGFGYSRGAYRLSVIAWREKDRLFEASWHAVDDYLDLLPEQWARERPKGFDVPAEWVSSDEQGYVNESECDVMREIVRVDGVFNFDNPAEPFERID